MVIPSKPPKFTGGYLQNQSYVEENHLLRGRYAKISTDDRGLYFFTEGRRPEVKKYNPRSEVDHLSITTSREVVFLHIYIYIYMYIYIYISIYMPCYEKLN